ncbi:MAG: MBL fold metallo-hydrolase [candidate division WOR-3 bacterium]
MKIVKISDRIYFFLRTPPSSNTVLIKGDVNIIIDPGYNPFIKERALSPLLKEAKLSIKDVDELWFTHCHPDHTGLAYYLLQKKQMRVLCHPFGKRIVECDPPIYGLMESEKIDEEFIKRIYPTEISKRKRLEEIVRFFVKLYGGLLSIGSHGIKIDECFSDGEIRYGIKILFLPGHTQTEVGFLDKSVLIMGDLIATFSFRRPAVLNVPSSDIDEAIFSLRKIMKISPKLILPGHGNYSKIDLNLIKEIYERTVSLRERGISLIQSKHAFIPYFIGLQKLLPLNYFRTQERLALLFIIYKSYVKRIT